MKWYNIILIGIILVGIIFVQRKFYPNVEIIKHSDTIFSKHIDTVLHTKLVPYKEQLPPDTVLEKIDTAKIIEQYLIIHKDYYTKRYYKETYKIDTIGTASIKGRVFMNKLDSLEFTYNLKAPTIINTIIVANPKNSLYIGGLVGTKSIMPIVIWNNKEKYNYFIGYDLVQKSFNVGIAVNINKIKF
jgi:hypothetical protein